MHEVSSKKQILNNNKPLLNYYNHDTFIIQAISWTFYKWDRCSFERCLVVGHMQHHLTSVSYKKKNKLDTFQILYIVVQIQVNRKVNTDSFILMCFPE